MKINERKIHRIFTAICMIFAVLGIVLLGKSSFNDIEESKKAEEVINSLTELRIALEEYYQVTKRYPDLTLEGAKDNLKLLDFTDDSGKKISFAEIYGRNTIPKTPKANNINETNEIFNTKNFDNGTEKGGWNYDYTNQTGEIHANLRENAYLQGIKWEEY
ncbi:hypothetical protein [Fusobacterium sp.]|uniref:hypothetical protein n=1 Tax=Fusobacterium sp. TaxID=68766 RepID=UPI00396CDFBA